MNCLYQTKRIFDLKEKMLSSKRYASIEQARIITRVYQENEKLSLPKKRALSLKAALEELEISVEDEELIVGNRTKGVRYWVVFPESGCSWINQEFETLPTRPQDQFLVKEEDIKEFREKIYPYWKGKSLEDAIKGTYGIEINEISKVVKINQKDHAQGHICPDSALWLKLGPQGLMEKAKEKLKNCKDEQKEFYECTILVLEGAVHFMQRYHDLIESEKIESLKEVGKICMKLSKRPPETFHEAVQSLWFLFVILHMESNASSFSPGRMDQYLYPYYQRDIEKVLNLRRSTISGILKTMEKHNIIIRTDSKIDARSKKIELSSTSLKFYNESRKVFEKVNSILTKDIDTDDLEIFFKVAKKMKENLNEEKE